MGGGDKALQLLGSRAILSWVVERLQPQVKGLVLNVNGDPGRFASWGLPMIADSVGENCGPLAGILAGMEWASRSDPLMTDLVSVPTDTPFLPRDLVDRLVAARATQQAEIALAARGERIHFATALWPVSLAASLRESLLANDSRRVETFARRHCIAIVKFDEGDTDPFLNINTPEDLASAEALTK